MATVTQHPPSKPIIVVGVDGSSESLEALRCATRYASLCDGEVHAVIAWEHQFGFGFFPGGAADLENEARRTLERSVHRVLDPARAAGVVMKVIHGHPTEVLVNESRTAHLLVVGHRGYGGFAGLLLGSVGENCVRHAKCSVLVAREES